MSDLDRIKQKYDENPTKKPHPRLIKTEKHTMGGHTYAEKKHEEYYEEDERITHVDDSEETSPQDNESIVMRDGRVLKRERKQKFFDESTGTLIERHAVEEFMPIERHEEIKSLDGFVYQREITEKSYIPEENAIVTRHGIDQKRLDCGHIMQGSIYQCSVCGGTLCGDDNCGAIVNGRVLCNAHVMTGRNLKQLYR